MSRLLLSLIPRLLTLALSLAILPPAAAAQTSLVTGTAFDQGGAPLPGALVELRTRSAVASTVRVGDGGRSRGGEVSLIGEVRRPRRVAGALPRRRSGGPSRPRRGGTGPVGGRVARRLAADGQRARPALRPRALVEDGSVRSEATTLVNMDARVRLAGQMRVVVDVFNLFDAKGSDIDYFYASRLPGEPAEGVADRHFHPAVPRTVRVSLAVGF